MSTASLNIGCEMHYGPLCPGLQGILAHGELSFPIFPTFDGEQSASLGWYELPFFGGLFGLLSFFSEFANVRFN